MATQLHTEGELLILEAAFDGRDVEIGLYNDDTDDLADGATFGDITTEPSGSEYASQVTQNVTISENQDGNGEAVYDDVTFNTSDSSEDVDAAYVRDESGGDLIFTASLDQTYDLDSVDTFILSNTGLNID